MLKMIELPYPIDSLEPYNGIRYVGTFLLPTIYY